MPVSSGSILLRAAVHLNDPSQSVYTAAILLPFLNMALDELSEEMAVYELSPLIQDSISLPVAINTEEITALPVDFVETIGLAERPQGSTSTQWVEIFEVDQIDPNLAVNKNAAIVEWATRNNQILINPPTSAREVLLTYLRGLAEADGSNNIDIDITRNFLSLVTARNAATDAGNSPSKGSMFENRINQARDRFIRRMQKNTQSLKGVRRLPYHGRRA